VAKFAEFFAGIGLVREALEPLGWECAFSNDISGKKAEMFRARFGDRDLVVEDVADLSTSDLPRDIDLVTASFPCIDLSLAGNRNGIDGRHSGAFWPFARLLERYCEENGAPRAVLLENVIGFASSRDGDDLERVISALNALGYRCDVVLVDARWFVPQSRPRLFVIGLRSDEPTMSPIPDLDVSRLRPNAVQKFLRNRSGLLLGALEFPEPPSAGEDSLVDLLEDVPAGDSIWWPAVKTNSLIQSMHERHRSRIENLGQNGNACSGTIYRRVRGGRTVGEIRTDGVAGCLRTPMGGSSVQFLAQRTGDEIRIRRMTGREYARLQGVDDGYPIQVSDRQAMLGFGDAVCVPAVAWLAKHAFGHLMADSDVTVEDSMAAQEPPRREANPSGAV
jgi:DNA (cytosine-5)-methyltransferase 1